MTHRPAHEDAELQGKSGELGQPGVAVGVLAHEPLGRAERLEVVGVVRLELVDDEVSHTDRPAAESDEEQGEERQHPVGQKAPDEGPRDQVGMSAVGEPARDGEEVADPARGKEEGEQQSQPGIGRAR